MTTKKLTIKALPDDKLCGDHTQVLGKLETLNDEHAEAMSKIRKWTNQKDALEGEIFDLLVRNRMNSCLKVDWRGFHDMFYDEAGYQDKAIKESRKRVERDHQAICR